MLIYPCGEPPGIGQLVAIVPGVFWIRMPLAPPLLRINLWAIEDGDCWTLVDTGQGDTATVELWRGLLNTSLAGRPISRVLVTHMHLDHIGLAGWLTQETRCRLWMTRLEYLQARIFDRGVSAGSMSAHTDFYRAAGWDASSVQNLRLRLLDKGTAFSELPSQYRRIVEGETIRIGQHDWSVLIGSGHSPEHACFFCPELDLLISGDQVLPRISSHVGVLPQEPDADPMTDWLDSLRKLRSQLPDSVLVLPSHQEPFRGLHARLDSLELEQRQSSQRLLLALQVPKRAVDLFSVMFNRKIDAKVLWLATNETLADLNYLIAQGLCVRTCDANGVAWYEALSRN